MQQNYNSFILGFNNASKTLQLTTSGLSVYSGTISSNNKLVTFSSNGMGFYNTGTYIGTIGTNNWSGYESYRGLVFDLEYSGKYMTWARKSSSTSKNYDVVLTYARRGAIYDKEGLYIATAAYMDGYELNKPNLTEVRTDGYSTYTGTRTFVTNITARSDGGINWTTSTYSICNGMFIN